MTVAGEVRLSRVYWECSKCLGGGCLLDERLGIEGRYSQGVERLMCLAAGSWSYDVSSDRLEEFCGLSISDTTIREVATRDLPRPLARIPYAAIEASESFGPRSKAWAKRLGLADISAITVLADGAKWIWEEQRQHLTQADGVLDIFHVIEHLTATSKALLA